MAEFVAPGLALPERSAQTPKRLVEKRLNVVGLQAPGFGPFHVLADAVYAAGVHRIMGQGSLFEQIPQFASVEGMIDRLGQPGAHIRLLAVTDGFEQQVSQGSALKLEFAQHVEDLTAQGLARLLQLVEQRAIHVALAGLVRHEVPQVAHLGLADTVNAPEPLLKTVWVPGQVVVDHQVGALQVDAFGCRIGCQQDLDLGIVPKRFLRLEPLLAAHTAVNHHHGLLAAQQRRHAVV